MKRDNTQQAKLSEKTFAPTVDSRLQTRCPECGSQTNLETRDSTSKLICTNCGNPFSLLIEETVSLKHGSVEKVAHFELLERLGGGAFGTVFKAKDTLLDRIVAVKIPHQSQLSKQEADMFLREARTAAQLRHPNIVSVHEVGRDSDQVFLVADFIDGYTLSDQLTGPMLSKRDAVQLIVTICRAVNYAHQQGVIHRDLKPSNTMIDKNGNPYVTDFGLAKREVGDVTMTQTGQVLGTPAYMSPEQAQGNSNSVDRRADIYAIGVMLFELLTNERPFRGNRRMLMHQVLHEEAPSPRKFNAHIERDLETICLKCLEKDPNRRFSTAGEMADELERYLNGVPIVSRRIGKLQRGWRLCRRNPLVSILSLSVCVALLLGTVFSSLFAFSAVKESGRADSRALFAKQQEKQAVANAKEANRLAQAAQRQAFVSGAEASLSKRRYSEAVSLNRQARKQGDDWQVGFQANRIADWCLNTRRIKASFAVEGKVIWARLIGKDRLIFQQELPTTKNGDQQFEVVVGIIDSQNIACRKITSRPWQFPAVSKNETLVFAQQGSLKLIRTKDLTELESRHVESEIIKLEVARNQSRLCMLLANGSCEAIDIPTLDRVDIKDFGKVTSGIDRFVFSISPSGKRALCRFGNQLVLWNIDSQKLIPQSTVPHYIRFASQDSDAIGLAFHSVITTNLAIDRYTVSEDKVAKVQGARIIARNVMVNGQVTWVEVSNYRDWNDAKVGMRFQNDYSTFSIDESKPGNTYRPEDLLPQVEGESQLLTQSIDDSIAVVEGGKRIFVMRLRSQSAEFDSVIHGESLPSANWLCAADSNAAYGIDHAGRLFIREFDGVRREKILKAPLATDGLMMTPFGLIASENGNLAVMWQENDKNGSASSKFTRKILTIYKLPDVATSGPISATQTIFMPKFDGIKARKYRRFFFTHDEASIVFVGSIPGTETDRRLVAFDVSSGKLLKEMVVSQRVLNDANSEYFFSFPDEPGALEVYSDRNWQIVGATIQVHKRILGCTIEKDKNLIHVGFGDKTLVQYDLTTGDRVGTIENAPAPFALIPNSEFYFGYTPVADSYGRLVLARLSTGQLVENLFRSVWFDTQFKFSSANDAIIFPAEKGQVRVIQSISDQRLSQKLWRTPGTSEQWRLSEYQTEKLTANYKRLTLEAKRYLEKKDLESATEVYEKLTSLPSEAFPTQRIKNSASQMMVTLYARQLDWEKALKHRIASGINVLDPIQLILLYQSGKIDQYETARTHYFKTQKGKIPKSLIHTVLIIGTLSKPTQEIVPILRELAKQNELSNLDYEFISASRTMFEIGEYDQWVEQLPKDRQPPENDLYFLLAKFKRATPEESPKLRVALQRHEKWMASVVEKQAKTKSLSIYYHNFAETQAELRTIRRVLAEKESQSGKE